MSNPSDRWHNSCVLQKTNEKFVPDPRSLAFSIKISALMELCIEHLGLVYTGLKKKSNIYRHLTLFSSVYRQEQK